jgi:MFS superfamily sulfate permease-like transporter
VVILLLTPKLLPKVPSALVAMVFAAAAVRLLGLEAHGVQIVGAVPAGLPQLRSPSFPPEMLPQLCEEAAGLALVSFSSMMLTARSFASKNGYDIDADKEFAALGASNIAAALSQGFAVSGADSRTAMNDSTGGRTQVAGLVAAATIGAVLMLFTGPLQYVPIAALGAVLIKAALSLVDLKALKTIYQIDRIEFGLSVLATLGVVAVGAIHAIFFAVMLAVLRFVKLVSRPKMEVLGEVEGLPGFHSVERHPNAVTVPGLVMVRFNAPIVFFNALYFKRQLMAAAEAAGPDLKWVVVDMLPIIMVDSTGLYTAVEVGNTLRARGIVFACAGRQTEWQEWSQGRSFMAREGKAKMFPTLGRAVLAYSNAMGIPAESADDADV